MIALLLLDGFIGFQTIFSIRGSISSVTDDQFRSVALIDDVQRAQAGLGSVLYRIASNASPAQRTELSEGVRKIERNLDTLFASLPPNDPDLPLWREVERAAADMADEAERILALPLDAKPDLTSLLTVRERLLTATSQLIRSNHERAEATKREIGNITSHQLWQDAGLLTTCVVIAILCAWLILRTTSRMQLQINQQADEIASISWQLLEKQEKLARRLSHELHDELGQSLTALKTNFTRHATGGCMDPSWASDCSQLLRDSIRSAHEISQLLRPTILDDFGLHAALAWLCERFENRHRIDVKYQSDIDQRFEPTVETHLFRIAQEALTNVVRHSQATEVHMKLSRENGNVKLHIADNGIGLASSEVDRSRPHFGMTGMRARARSLAGEMVVESSPGHGTEIRILFPWRAYEYEGAHSHPSGG